MGVSTSEELQHGISACKDLIKATRNDSEEKKKLVSKLVQLRLKLQERQVWLSDAAAAVVIVYFCNGPFYSCLLSDPAYEWQRGCR